MDASPYGRRDFLRRSAATGIGLAAGMLAAGQSSAAPRKTVRLGFIGVGTRGIGHPDFTQGKWATNQRIFARNDEY